MLWTLFATAAMAASLPGIALPFDVNPSGVWVLPAELPPAFANAGVQPGWSLIGVDGLKLGDDPASAQRIVATGPARNVRLLFNTPEGETIVVVPRGPLTVVEEVGLLPWPEGFKSGASSWVTTGDGVPLVVDGGGTAWSLDVATGAQTKVPEDRATQPLKIPDLWWALSDAPWVTMEKEVQSGDRSWIQGLYGKAARLTSFQGHEGDHLAVPTPEGLQILAIGWPVGTPDLPVCVPSVPETCLIAGRQISATLLERPGAKAEALRTFSIACEGGTYRACLEAVALEEPELAPRADSCGERDVNACHEVSRERQRKETGEPSSLLVGILEYTCAVDASGSLGERLRRLEDVGEGCVLLSEAFDKLQMPDRALLSLDQACVLGRAEACDDANRRRQEAFAMKTVRECEDPHLPLATSCVQLGRLLDKGPITATRMDTFDAYLRACKLGDEEGCTLLSDFVDRWGIEHPRVQQAERTLLDTCKTGEQRACVGAAHLLMRHEPRSEAYGKALTLFDAACDSGIPSSCVAGAEQRRIGSARKVKALSPVEMWKHACDLDSPAGCAGLGDRLVRSKNTWDEAYAAWNKACDTGDAGACTDLGRFVLNRHKTPWPGEQPSPAYLKRGCENGDAEGCYWLAEADLPKRGDPPEHAYVLLQRSCDGDFGTACADLADIHLHRNTNFDDEIAAGHLQSACDNGHFESCKALSSMYLQGKGVEQDPTKARELAQRYSVNASRRFFRLGVRLGFPSLAGGEAELVAPIPVGPAIAVTGSYSYLPSLGGFMVVLKGGDYPPADQALDFQYVDAGIRLYPNNKARGLYGMVAVHRVQASGPAYDEPFLRDGISGRIGMYSESGVLFTRVEMGIGQYGLIDLHDFDEGQSSTFPLIQATLAFTIGLAPF